jgi:hypothetical protein
LTRRYRSEPKWKRKEREVIAALQATFGRVSDPTLTRLLTRTGRVGHLTRFGFDGIVGNNPGFVVEVKVRKRMLTKQTINALLQTVDRAAQFGRIPLVAVVLGDDVPTRTASGVKVERNWVLIPLSELKKLVGKEVYE